MADEKIKVVVEGEAKTGAALNTAVRQIGQIERAVTALGGSSNLAVSRISSIATAFTTLTTGQLVVGGAIAAIAGLATAATVAAVNTSQVVEQLDRLSARTGIAIERLAAYKEIIEEGGGRAEGLGIALTFLNRAIATHDPLLAKLKITTNDTKTAFEQLAGILAKSGDEAKVTEVAFQLLGRGGAELIPHFAAIASGADKMEQQMSEASGGANRQMIPSMRALDEQLDRLHRNWQGFTNTLANFGGGAVQGAIKALNDLWDAIRGVKSAPASGTEIDAQISSVIRKIDQAQKVIDEITTRSNPSAGELANKDAIQARVDALKAQWRALIALRSAMGSDADRLRAIHGDESKTADPLAGLNFDKPKGPNEREKEIEKIMELLHRSRPQAEALVDALDKLRERTDRAALQGKLEEAGVLLDPDRALQTTTDLLEIGDGWRGLADEVEKDMKKTEDAVKNTMDAWITDTTTTTIQVLQTLTQMRSVYQAVFTGANVGIHQAFLATSTSLQTLRSAMTTFLGAIRDEVLNLVADIAAALIKLGVLKLVSFVTGVPLPALPGPESSTAQLPTDLLTTGLGGGPQIGTVNISAIDAKSTFEALTAPGGAFRRATIRVDELQSAVS